MTTADVVTGPVAEMAKYGLLGALLVLAGYVIVKQNGQIGALNIQFQTVLREYATLAAQTATTMDRVADTVEELNKVIDHSAAAATRQAEATRAHGALVEVNQARMLDRFAITDKVVEALAQSVRVTAKRGP